MGKSFIVGWNAIDEAMRSNTSLSKVWLLGSIGYKDKDFTAYLAERHIPCQMVPRVFLDRLVPHSVHQGVVAETTPLQFASVESVVLQAYELGEVPLVVICEGLNDVRNVGAIGRTALGAGATALLLSTQNTANLNTDSIKASAGALLHIPICRTSSMGKSLAHLQHSGVQLVVADSHADTLYTSLDYRLPTALIIGNEHEGVTRQTLSHRPLSVRIPVQGIDSLNASVAAAIILYEVWRQRNVAAQTASPTEA